MRVLSLALGFPEMDPKERHEKAKLILGRILKYKPDVILLQGMVREELLLFLNVLARRGYWPNREDDIEKEEIDDLLKKKRNQICMVFSKLEGSLSEVKYSVNSNLNLLESGDVTFASARIGRPEQLKDIEDYLSDNPSILSVQGRDVVVKDVKIKEKSVIDMTGLCKSPATLIETTSS